MAAESIWPGMFHAEAGRGNTASARSRDTVASHAISNEQRARKGPGQPAMNRSKQAGMAKKAIGALRQFSSRFSPSRRGAAAGESRSDRIRSSK